MKKPDLKPSAVPATYRPQCYVCGGTEGVRFRQTESGGVYGLTCISPVCIAHAQRAKPIWQPVPGRVDASDYVRPVKPERPLVPEEVWQRARVLQRLVEASPLCTAEMQRCMVPSAANLREHHHVRAKRVKRLREAGKWLACTARLTPKLVDVGIVVLLVRCAPRRLDDDNLAAALKPVRDGVADVLGVDDRDSRVTWVVAQEKGTVPRVRLVVVRR
jgi:hypothetical protein